MSELEEASAFSRSHMAHMRAQRAIKELRLVADEAARTVVAIHAIIGPLRETANKLAYAFRRANEHAEDLLQSIEPTK